MERTKLAKKKATFFMSEEGLSQMKELIAAKGLRSQNALVAETIREYIFIARREIRRKQYIDTSQDQMFRSNIEEIEKDFKRADEDPARIIS